MTSETLLNLLILSGFIVSFFYWRKISRDENSGHDDMEGGGHKKDALILKIFAYLIMFIILIDFFIRQELYLLWK